MEIIVKLDKDTEALLMQMAESISLLASATGFRQGQEPKEVKPVPTVEAPKEETPKTEEPKKEQTIKLADVRNILAQLTKLGRAAEAKTLIESFGAEKLTEVNPDMYPELLAKAKELI